MGVGQIMEALHEFIRRADERVLNLMCGMMKTNTLLEEFEKSLELLKENPA